MQQLAVDVGGTFTDLVVIDRQGAVGTLKVLSSPDDFSRSILDGVRSLSAAGAVDPAAIERLVHAFTVATNALLTHTGARVGLITTRGFRDVLEIGRLRMPQLYNMDWDKPKPLVPRRLRYEVRERLSAGGEVLEALDEADVQRAIDSLVKADVQSIAVCLLHSYVNPDHEKRVIELVRERAPHLPVSASHQVLPEIREYERTSTTVVNAYVKPVVDRYLERLEEGLRDQHATAPLMVMQSAGGVMRAAQAREFPAYCIESGPAAGAIGAAALGRMLDIPSLIAFDMGGTTAKACLIERGEPRLAEQIEVGAGLNAGQRLLSGGGYVVRTPAIDLAEIGAGGGSLAWIDAGGALRVGPQSAGADPGPACYGRGGQVPTVTDANVLLGYLNRTHLLDGSMTINADAAEQTIRRAIALPLGIGIHEAAFGIHAVANAAMARAVQAVTSEIGRSPADFTLVAFGGSGPVHAASLARHVAIQHIVIPPAPGVFSAFGLLFTRVEHRLVRTRLSWTAATDLEALNALAADLINEATALMAAENLSVSESMFDFHLDLRYRGQSSQLPVPVQIPLSQSGLECAVADFHREHDRTYGYSSLDETTQIVNLRLRARARDQMAFDVDAARVRPALTGRARHKQSTARDVFFGELGWHVTPVIRRDDLDERKGPLIIEEYDTTIVVPPHASVRRDRTGSVHIELQAPA